MCRSEGIGNDLGQHVASHKPLMCLRNELTGLRRGLVDSKNSPQTLSKTLILH